MTYRFTAIGDIHWGAFDAPTMFENLELFLEFIKQMKDKLDFVVISGDYFDMRLPLNSKTALYAINWFDKFVATCKEANVKKIRVFKGTKDHDNDQLEIFRQQYELDDKYVRIYNTTEVEELFPELKVAFCPDENVNLIDYHRLYCDKFNKQPDIGFFHGNFDNVLPSIEFDRIQNHRLPTMIYQYENFARLIKGPLISSHWHVRTNIESLYYIGSYDRWKHGEEEDKGFIYGEYDTTDSSYYIRFVVNPLAKQYKTIIIDSDDVYMPAHFASLSTDIVTLLREDPEMKIKVSYILSSDSEEALVNFGAFQKRFVNNNQVKIDVKNLVKRAIKKEKKAQVLFEASKYQYVFDTNTPLAEKIHKFILDRNGTDIPNDVIMKYIQKYIPSEYNVAVVPKE